MGAVGVGFLGPTFLPLVLAQEVGLVCVVVLSYFFFLFLRCRCMVFLLIFLLTRGRVLLTAELSFFLVD